MKDSIISLLLITCLFIGCAAPKEEISFVLKNDSDLARVGEVYEVSTDFLTKKEGKIDWSNIQFSTDKNLPFQLIDEDKNGMPEMILVSTDLKPGEEKTVRVDFSKNQSNANFQKRTQAEISHRTGGDWKERKYVGGDSWQNVTDFTAPPEHTDHSYFIRYEGPGWESDKVGYRFYLDWRNAVDIFGKKTSEPVLQKVGLDGFDSYHEPADWGMDILKVGKSLGIGAIGFWENNKATRIEKTSNLKCEILQNGNLQSKIRTTYSDWEINDIKTTLTSDLTIKAGSRLTRQNISLTETLSNLCTGIVKHDAAVFLSQMPNDNSSWGYIATYGKQSLADDNLGMAIFFQKENFMEITEDEHSHIVVLKPSDNHLEYYFAAAWEQEPEGIKNQKSFENYLENQTHFLSEKNLNN